MLCKILGNCAQVKLIDFLVAHPWSEFSKTELSEGSQIARPTVYKLLDKLLTEELIIKTKKIGNIQLYQTNRNSQVIKHLSSLQGLLADMELEKQKKINPDETMNFSDTDIDEILDIEDEITAKNSKEDKSKLNIQTDILTTLQ